MLNTWVDDRASSLQDRQLTPHSIETEQAVLGACLIDARALDCIAMLVDEDDFYEPAHRLIFGAMRKQRDAGRSVDFRLVAAALGAVAEVDLGGLTVHQYVAKLPAEATMRDAAQEIERVFHAQTSGLWCRGIDYSAVRGRPVEEISARLAMAYALRYKPWADQLDREMKQGGRQALAATIAIVIDDAAVRTVSLDLGMRKETVAFLVRRSLLLYAEFSGSVRKGATAAFCVRYAEEARAAKIPVLMPTD